LISPACYLNRMIRMMINRIRPPIPIYIFLSRYLAARE